MSQALNLIHNIERQLLWWADQQCSIDIQQNDTWMPLDSIPTTSLLSSIRQHPSRLRIGDVRLPLFLDSLNENDEISLDVQYPYYFSILCNGQCFLSFVGEQLPRQQAELEDHIWSNLQNAHHFFCRNFFPKVLLDQVRSLNVYRSTSSFPLLPLESCSTLEHLGLYHSQTSRRLPALSSLTSFIVDSCSNLQNVSGLEHATRLETVKLHWCEQLQFLPFLHTSQLRTISIRWCNKVEYIFSLSNQQSLRHLDIQACGQLKELPSLENCRALQYLNFSWFSNISSIPDLSHVTKLRQLTLRSLGELTDIPDLSGLSQLESLNINDCPKLLTLNLPKLEHLLVLEANGCSNLQRLEISQTTRLKKLSLARATNFTEILGLTNNDSLEQVFLTGANKLQTLEGLSNNSNLKFLQINDCYSLTTLPSFSALKQLETLQVYGCPNLQEIQGSDNLTELRVLQLGGCRSLKSIPNVQHLPKLEELTLSWFHNDVQLFNLSGLQRLKKLKLSGHSHLRRLNGLEQLTSLEELNLSRCISLDYLTNLSKLVSLQKLILRGCRSLSSLQGIMELNHLREVILSHCSSLEDVDELYRKPSLQHLDISFCRNLRKTPRLHGETLSSLEFLNLSNRIHHTDLAKLQVSDQGSKLQEINLEGVHNISNLDALKSFFNLKSIVGLPVAKANYFIAHAAVQRQDVRFINRNFTDWLTSLPSSNRADEFLRILVEAAEIVELGEHSWLEILNTLRKIERNSQGDSYISEQGWETFFARLSDQTFSPMGIIVQLLHSQRIDLLQEANAFRGFLNVFLHAQRFPKEQTITLLEQVYLRSSERFKRYYSQERERWNTLA